MATLSVIVPVFNVEKYLPACLDSILIQTGFEFEIILVDDGSSDESGSICDSYSKKDSRIKVFHIDNNGVSNARNLGIEKSNSDFVAFVDSDDELPINTYQTCADSLEKSKELDCIIFGYEIIRDDRRLMVLPKEGQYFGTEFGIAYEDLLISFLIHSPVNKIYRREIINSTAARFPTDMALGEDLIFNNCFIKGSKSVKVLNQALYYYYQRGSGSLTTKYHHDLFSIYCRHWENIMNTLEFYGQHNENIRISSLFSRYTRDSINILFHNKCPLTILNKIIKIHYILNHSYTIQWISTDKHKDFYWWLMKNKCVLFLVIYIYASKCKHRLFDR